MELHQEVGPARTTVSAVAQRAGVERVTVYRHFPDEPSMLRACSALWNELNPPPDLLSAKSPRAALERLYGWYRANERMLVRVHADAEHMPVVAEQLAPFEEFLDDLAAKLERGSQRRITVRHALEFSTWRSLSRLTKSDAQAAAIAARWGAEC